MAGKMRYVALAAVGLVAGSMYLYQNLGGIITRTAEKIASDALGVTVAIGSIDVSLSEKKVTVNTLKIGNPPGYRNDYAITADKLLIGLNTASKQLIDFNDIQVKGSIVNLEVNEKGMNIVDLKNLANRKEQKGNVGSEQIRVIVQHMVIDASVINPSTTLFKADIKPIRMPAVKLSNIGKGNGLDAGSAIVEVLTQYLSAVEKEAGQGGMLPNVLGVDDAKKNMGDQLGVKATDGLKKQGC